MIFLNFPECSALNARQQETERKWIKYVLDGGATPIVYFLRDYPCAPLSDADITGSLCQVKCIGGKYHVQECSTPTTLPDIACTAVQQAPCGADGIFHV